MSATRTQPSSTCFACVRLPLHAYIRTYMHECIQDAAFFHLFRVRSTPATCMHTYVHACTHSPSANPPKILKIHVDYPHKYSHTNISKFTTVPTRVQHINLHAQLLHLDVPSEFLIYSLETQCEFYTCCICTPEMVLRRTSCVYMYVCMYVCMCVHTYIHTYMHAYKLTHAYIPAHIYKHNVPHYVKTPYIPYAHNKRPTRAHTHTYTCM
jgi:hypothetical protein